MAIYGQSGTLPGADVAQSDIPKPCPADAWVKRGVVIEPTEPWEINDIQNFNSTVEVLPDDRWRIWYGVNHPDPATGHRNIAYAEGQIGKVFEKTAAMLTDGEPTDAPLSIGHLPKGWEPVQPVHLKLQNGKHRIYFWAHGMHGEGVQRFLAADSDDGKKYRVVNALTPCLYTIWDRAVPRIPEGTTTPWGLRATHPMDGPRPADEPDAPVELITNDGATVYQLPDGSFEMYVQTLVSIDRDDPRFMEHDNIPGSVRVIDRFVSDDGLKWKERTRVLEPDKLDSIDTQFYYFTVTHTDRGRVGLLGHYYVKEQYMDLEWCYSQDGLKWERPNRKEWIRRGKPGEPDSYTIYPPNSIIHRDGQWWFFYTGVNYGHNVKHAHGEPRSVIMAASTPNLWDN